MSEDTAGKTERIRSRLNPRRLSWRYRIGILALLFLAALPLLLSFSVGKAILLPILPGTSWQLALYSLTSAFFFAMFAMSWDTVSGYTGEISFGHGLFFAVGAYTSALLNLGHGVSPLLSIPAGIVVAALVGAIIGIPALRLEGPYLSLVTLVAPLILIRVFVYFSDIFKGRQGLPSPANLVGYSDVANYFLALALFVVVLAFLLIVTRSNTGSILTAIREDEDAVAAAGLSPAKFKIFAFVLSAAIGGLAGAVFVHTPNGQPSPSELLAVIVNVEVIIAAVLGGMGTITGAAVGGFFVYLVPQYLGQIDYTVPFTGLAVSDMGFFLFALFTLILLNVFPGGLVRWGIGLGRRAIGDGDDVTAADGGRTPLEQTRDRYRQFFEERFGGDDE
ncbi:MAG: branched-chain amino acid ABC transporter permease [Haloarculaceae archaeon]